VFGGYLIKSLERHYPSRTWHAWRLRQWPLEPDFWKSKENRVKFTKWLAKAKFITTPEQWYALCSKDIEDNGASGVLQVYPEIKDLVQESFPELKLREWLFSRLRRGWWLDVNNHRRFWMVRDVSPHFLICDLTICGDLQEFTEDLGIPNMTQWYSISKRDLPKLQVLRHNDTVLQAVTRAFPEHQWDEWKFKDGVPTAYWFQQSNISRFIADAQVQLGVASLEGWYKVTLDQLMQLPCGMFR
jgi:hypothetical protein